MTNARDHRSWICWARRRALSGALTAGIVLLPLIASQASAQETTPTYTVLYNFTGGTDGGNPNAGLIADEDGNLYGTAQAGGNTSSTCPFGSYGCGVVFKLDPAGNETTLYAFTGGADGDTPVAGLIRDADGNLYGTTYWGGIIPCNPPYGCGVVFKLDPAGNETVLYSFPGGANGNAPIGGVIRDAAGNIYGTTVGGGSTSGVCGLPGCGLVFKLDPSGKETVLYTFTGGADGQAPYDGLIRDQASNLYGTTWGGGNTSSSCINGPQGCGVVFRLDRSGKETVLYTFSGGADGSAPYAGLVRDPVGNLYGTTGYGGDTSCSSPTAYLGCGVVFKINPWGKETVLYTLSGGADGFLPWTTGVVFGDGFGDLYGTTVSGGDSSCSSGLFTDTGCGVVFRVGSSGKQTVLHTFVGTDGASPAYGSLLPHKGSLYGTTYSGGAYTSPSCSGTGCGVVFRLH